MASRMNWRIALPVADMQRDLPGTVLTAYRLCEQGATCYVLPYRASTAEIWALAPDFVLLPVFRPYAAPVARRFVRAGIRFGLIDTEGVVWSSLDEYKTTLWNDASLSAQAAVVCAWGPLVADFLVREKLFRQDQVYVTGCPRFDFYAEPWKKVYSESGENGTSRRCVLVNTNFTVANPRHGRPIEGAEQLAATYGYDRREVMEWYERGKVSVEGMAELASCIARDFPDLDVILRPHPQENSGTYERLLQGQENVAISTSGPVTPLMLRAAVVIQRSCTTALEACMTGAVALSPQWLPTATYYPLPESVSVPCNTYSELCGVLQDVSANRFTHAEPLKSSISDCLYSGFYYMDGKAHDRAATAVIEHLHTKKRTTDVSECRRFLFGIYEFGKRPGAVLGGLARRALGLPAQHVFRRRAASGKAAPSQVGFGIESIRMLLQRVALATGSQVSGIEVTEADALRDYIEEFRGCSVALRQGGSLSS
jgi:surface carbohydrate biosynthesis protein